MVKWGFGQQTTWFNEGWFNRQTGIMVDGSTDNLVWWWVWFNRQTGMMVDDESVDNPA